MVVVRAVVGTRATNALSSVMVLRRPSVPPSIFCSPSHNHTILPLPLLRGKHCPLLLHPKVLISQCSFLKLARCNPLVLLRSVLCVDINYFLKIRKWHSASHMLKYSFMTLISDMYTGVRRTSYCGCQSKMFKNWTWVSVLELAIIFMFDSRFYLV